VPRSSFGKGQADRSNPPESLDSQGCASALQLQTESSQHKNFGQPVVSDPAVVPRPEDGDEPLLTPAQAAARFEIPEYLLRQACAEDRLVHLRVVNTLWWRRQRLSTSLARGEPRSANVEIE